MRRSTRTVGTGRDSLHRKTDTAAYAECTPGSEPARRVAAGGFSRAGQVRPRSKGSRRTGSGPSARASEGRVEADRVGSGRPVHRRRTLAGQQGGAREVDLVLAIGKEPDVHVGQARAIRERLGRAVAHAVL